MILMQLAPINVKFKRTVRRALVEALHRCIGKFFSHKFINENVKEREKDPHE